MINTQMLANFIAEFTCNVTPNSEMDALEEQNQDDNVARWKLFIDGSSNQHGGGDEYEAFLVDFRVTTELEVESLDVYSDSQLVINLVQGDYLAKDLRMMAYLDEMKAISIKIKDIKICQIPREENKKVDALANLVLAFDFILDRSVPLEFFLNPSIDITLLNSKSPKELRRCLEARVRIRGGGLCVFESISFQGDKSFWEKRKVEAEIYRTV
ncbi:hypothetical protein Acr_00g0027750 [Actinidia rufa]|uniref:RNase H type-1 domain-containing protein n=1 Tax=Actinidia rufa TaxID=165716 RepID=A0A7J0DFY4_9ERIC|nr:hypothetical protein Acr_00g0027750 [Actinidia rufa]